MSNNKLNPEKALIFRITHVDNVAWILDHGVYCQSGGKQDPRFRRIGNPDLIIKRSERVVEILPGGKLSDYIPFYFTPWSIMLLNIKTGFCGVPRLPNTKIVFLVSSLPKVQQLGIQFVFTDHHAYSQMARYFNRLDDLPRIDWDILQRRDFKHQPDDPGKKERYQAEALVYRHLPIDGLLGLVCFDDQTREHLQVQLDARGMSLTLLKKRRWYF